MSMHPDDEVLANLAGQGSDLSAVHKLEHFLYFKSAAAASGACAELERSGFTILSDGSVAQLGDFFVHTCISLIPERQKVIALSDQLDALAKRWAGDYDGWEASIVRRSPDRL